MAADEPAGPPPATAKSKSYRRLAIVIRSSEYHFEAREAGNFFCCEIGPRRFRNNDPAQSIRLPGMMLTIWLIVRYNLSRQLDHQYHTRVTLLTILEQD